MAENNQKTCNPQAEVITRTYNPTDTPVRMKEINGTLWFAAKDVAKALNITWSGHTLDQIPDEWKGVVKFTTPGGEQELITISESGMYKLAFRCQSSEAADKFTNWVAGEVLPAIRKTGLYVHKGATAPVRRYRTRGEAVNTDIMNLLWLIGESLERGDQKQIAMQIGVSVQAIQNVLNGYNRSSRILAALYNKARQNREAFMLYNQPALMAQRLLTGEPTPEGNHLPAIKITTGRGGALGNQNARKYPRNEKGGSNE